MLFQAPQDRSLTYLNSSSGFPEIVSGRYLRESLDLSLATKSPPYWWPHQLI